MLNYENQFAVDPQLLTLLWLKINYTLLGNLWT